MFFNFFHFQRIEAIKIRPFFGMGLFWHGVIKDGVMLAWGYVDMGLFRMGLYWFGVRLVWGYDGLGLGWFGVRLVWG